jgi:hypothetical protein
LVENFTLKKQDNIEARLQVSSFFSLGSEIGFFKGWIMIFWVV